MESSPGVVFAVDEPSGTSPGGEIKVATMASANPPIPAAPSGSLELETAAENGSKEAAQADAGAIEGSGSKDTQAAPTNPVTTSSPVSKPSAPHLPKAPPSHPPHIQPSPATSSQPAVHHLPPSSSMAHPTGQQQYLQLHPAPTHVPPANQNRPAGMVHPQLNDALAYLDRVKAEFIDQPEVYNKFLQIMRDFKVNAIDSNGVIYRLVNLFMGHKSLIEGFNAFLPKSHHIDPMIAETGILPPHVIAAAVQSGLAPPPQAQVLSQAPHQAISAGQKQMPPPSSTHQTINLSHFVQPGSGPWPMDQPPPQQGYYGPGPVPSYPMQAPIQSQGHLPQQPLPQQPQAPQKQHAIPIRTGPALAVSKPSNIAIAVPTPVAMGGATPIAPGLAKEAVVGEAKKASPQFNKAFGYVKKIKHRFSSDPDTYKAFLAALHAYHKEQVSIHEVYEQVSLLFRDNSDLLAEFMQFLPEQDAAAIIQKTSQRPPIEPAPPIPRISEVEVRPIKRSGGQSTNKAVKRARQATAMLSAYPSTAGYATSQRSHEENEFFEKVKAYLGSRAVYAEFLKCLNLFSQDILKLDDLLRLVNGFIGGSDELYGWFKRYIGLKEPQLSASESAHWKNTAAGISSEIQELNLQSCKRLGSYRMYPKTHKIVKASGRTVLCDEVLNDNMVSCPTFSSEDSTFVGSKKNQYEEALFKCEDERYELDLLIEHNLATIAVFEPLAKRFEMMAQEERSQVQLSNNLGGASEIIYKKAIRKIYGEKSEEIIENIKKNPTIAIPIVLNRLKQKDEEWRRMQRDWNKIWRDIHLKNYYKALDHQGIEFKNVDKKNFAVKNLVTEIEAIYQESSKLKDRERLVGGNSINAPNHLEFSLKESDRLVEDLVKLVKTFLKSTSGFSNTDRKAILKFFCTFVPEFFAWKRTGPKEGTVPSEENDFSSDSDGENEPSPLKLSTSDDFTITRLLFANNTLFGFMRLLEMALERLGKMRTCAQLASEKPHFSERNNIVATFLDLQVRIKYPNLGSDYYKSLLYLLKQLLYGELDSSAFEEQARFMFANDAYPMYTFDKLLQAIVKQAQLVLIDPACEHLIRLFDSWKDLKRSGKGSGNWKLSEYSIRLAAENYVSANPRDNLYRIEFVPKTSKMGFQMLEKLFDSAGGSVEAKWSAYVDGFVKLDPNSLYLNPKSKVFLKRCLRKSSDSAKLDDSPVVEYNLECKICINTYKLFYVENTEDCLYRKGRHQSPTMDRRDGSRNLKRFKQWWFDEWEVLGYGPVEEAESAFLESFSLV